jgi:hypothetical protein
MKHTIVGAAAAMLLAVPLCASAQQTETDARTVQDVLGFLVTNQGVPTGDIEADREAAEATRSTLTRALLASIATVPVGTSSSGFTYRFNPTLGTVERASEGFGPFFIERALTAGGGQASLGFTFQYASFSSLDGHDLGDGQFVTISRQFRDEPEPFEVETLTLDITTSTATFYGNVGLTDRVDVAVAVPLVRLEVNGNRNNTYRGRTLPVARGTAETVGLADIAVRSKVRLTGEGPAHVAAGVEVRLPTGREEDLLGAGDTAVRFQGLASAEAGRTSVHGNVSLGTGGIGREYSYGGAVTVAATPQVTLVGELLARRITGFQRIAELITPQPRIAGVDTRRLVPSGEDRTTAFAVAGFKWNVSGTWLLQGNVLIPMTDTGLTAKFTPTLSLDYSFTR